jgi:hypothetical protein
MFDMKTELENVYLQLEPYEIAAKRIQLVNELDIQ